MRTSVVAIGADVLLAGCASVPTPVPVVGPRAGLSGLVGDWSGEYSSPETGRSGSISFKLEAGKDTAFGSVVMVPRVQYDRVTGGTPVERPTIMAAATQKPTELLTIRFVRMEGNQIVGTPGSDDRVIHARLSKGSTVLMASDSPAGMPVTQGDNFWIKCGLRWSGGDRDAVQGVWRRWEGHHGNPGHVLGRSLRDAQGQVRHWLDV